MFYLASIQMFHFIFIVKLLAFVAHVVFKVVICSLQSSHMKLCHGKNGKYHTMEEMVGKKVLHFGLNSKPGNWCAL